jgi:hypothetical protein
LGPFKYRIVNYSIYRKKKKCWGWRNFVGVEFFLYIPRVGEKNIFGMEFFHISQVGEKNIFGMEFFIYPRVGEKNIFGVETVESRVGENNVRVVACCAGSKNKFS